MDQPTQQQIQVKITDEIVKGVYANNMTVMHTAEEFILDFMNILPPNGTVTARVIISPGHLKRIIAALQDNVSKYEKTFGEIKIPQGQVAGQSATTSTEPHKIGFQAE